MNQAPALRFCPGTILAARISRRRWPEYGQVMRVITKDGFVKPDSIQVLIDLVRENTKSLQAFGVTNGRRPSGVPVEHGGS
jgi:hypothetical protein